LSLAKAFFQNYCHSACYAENWQSLVELNSRSTAADDVSGVVADDQVSTQESP